jgi:MFS transporter, SP family, xylose:H+ symportor
LKNNYNILEVTLIAALGGLLFGYDTAVISGAIGSLTAYFHLSPVETGWAISSALIGCLIGALVADFCSTKFGRKNSLLLAALLFSISAIGTALPDSFSWFIIFRIVGGLGVGIASMVVPMYIAEIAPKDQRGKLVGYNQLAVVAGIVLVYFVNYFIALQGNEQWNLQYGWRWMFASELVPSLLFFGLLFLIPESPRWLLLNNKKEQAVKILRQLNVNNSQDFVKDFELSISKKNQKAQWSLLFHPSIKLALFTGIGLSVFQQITGINAILYYAPEIFKDFGSSRNTALLETSILGICNLVFTLVAIKLVDKKGRRPLLLIGTTGMLIALLVVGGSVYLQIHGSWLLIFLLLFMASFSISWGPVVWVLLSEIFPNHVKSLALSIAVFIQWIANFLVSQTFPIIQENTLLRNTFHGAFPFMLYAVSCLVAFVFVWKMVPETKNKTLEQMNAMWDDQVMQNK